MWRDSEYNEMYIEFTLFVVEINNGLGLDWYWYWIGIGLVLDWIGEEMGEMEMCFVLCWNESGC